MIIIISGRACGGKCFGMLGESVLRRRARWQRAYAWNITQCDKLWQDIEAYIELDADDPYFFGTVIVDCSIPGELNLIDGQQRTTTFLLLIKAIQLRLAETIKNFKEMEENRKSLELLRTELKGAIKILCKCDETRALDILEDWDLARGVTVLRSLSINEQYKDTLNELQKILEAKDYDEAERNVYKIPRKQKDNKYTNFFRNFKFFYEKLGEYGESQIQMFAHTVLAKCQVIEIRSWQIEQAITMFNSLNSTGMPLSDADIISAQLYANADGDEGKQQFNKIWERIIKRCAELAERKITSVDGVLQQFMYITRAKDRVYLNPNGGAPDIATPGLRNYYTGINSGLLRDPFMLGGALEKIAVIWENIKDYPVVKLLLKFNENSKIYLMSYLYDFELADITLERVQGIAECLLRLFTVLELVDSGYSSANFKTFLYGENIKLVDKTYPFEEIERDFQEHIWAKWTPEGLRQGLMEYEGNILVFLNEYLYAQEKGLLFDFAENVNVEHIMPASGHNLNAIREDAGIADAADFDFYVNQLGNKILLEENINKAIGREWFVTKKQSSVKAKRGYKDSRHNIAAALVEYPKDRWGKEDIEMATRKAAGRILRFVFSS